MKTTFDVFHILHEKSQVRMFLNSKNEIYLELTDEYDKSSDKMYICLDMDEAKAFEIRLANLIVRMDEKTDNSAHGFTEGSDFPFKVYNPTDEAHELLRLHKPFSIVMSLLSQLQACRQTKQINGDSYENQINDLQDEMHKKEVAFKLITGQQHEELESLKKFLEEIRSIAFAEFYTEQELLRDIQKKFPVS